MNPIRASIIILGGISLMACGPGQRSVSDTPPGAGGAGGPGGASGATASGRDSTPTPSPTPGRSDTQRPGATTPPASSNEVVLTLDRTSYAAGATVTMRIENHGRDTLGYNQCSSRVVERERGSTWVTHAEPDRMCTMELRMLAPHETQTATTDLPATLAAGNYRVVLTLSRQRTPAAGEKSAGSVRAVSPTFRVS